MTQANVVMIVEDEEDSREMLRDILVLQGYEVEVAGNGVEALARLDELSAQPSVMLLDLYMPVMNGLELLDQLRESGRLSDMNVVVTTSAPEKVPAGLRVVEKPLDVNNILSLVRSLCLVARKRRALK